MQPIVEIKKKYYKELREEQKVVELFSSLLEGCTISKSIDTTMDIFPRDIFVDGGVEYVYD